MLCRAFRAKAGKKYYPQIKGIKRIISYRNSGIMKQWRKRIQETEDRSQNENRKKSRVKIHVPHRLKASAFVTTSARHPPSP